MLDRLLSRHARTVHVHIHIVYCAQMFLFQATKMLNNIILTDTFFLQSENLALGLAKIFGGQPILANRLIKLYIFHGNSLLRDRLPRTKQNGCLLFM